MVAHLSADPDEIMVRNLETLSAYARRVILKGERLAEDEDEDRLVHLREFFGIGTSFDCTEKDLVTLLYRDVFGARRMCGCPSCRSRIGSG